MPPETTAESSALTIEVNGTVRRVPTGIDLAALIEQLGLGGKRVAVACNRNVVPRSSYDAHVLCDGDRLEILEAVGGG